jgi:hypothetical protein
MSWVYGKADVKKVDYKENLVEVSLEADPEFAEKVKKRVQELHGKIEIFARAP